jgi:hypothetical protein
MSSLSFEEGVVYTLTGFSFATQFTCFTSTTVQILTSDEGVVCTLTVEVVSPDGRVERSAALLFTAAARYSLYLLYWYKSTISDAAGVRHSDPYRDLVCMFASSVWGLTLVHGILR